MRGRNDGTEKYVFQMRFENRWRVNEMEIHVEKKTDIQGIFRMGGIFLLELGKPKSLIERLLPQPCLHEYLFSFALLPVQLQPR